MRRLTKLLGLAIVAVIVALQLVWLSGFMFGNDLFGVSDRAGVSLCNRVFLELRSRLEKYHNVHGRYPPVNNRNSYYGPLPAEIADTIAVPDVFSNRHMVYNGPPVDPYRKESLHAKEQQLRTWYWHPRDAEFRNWFRGYSPRYYVSDELDLAVILSNGPDSDIDITPSVLDKLTTSALEDFLVAVAPYTFDPTNGSASNGDLHRLVTPENAQ